MSKYNQMASFGLRLRPLAMGLALMATSFGVTVATTSTSAADEALLIDAEGIVQEVTVGESKVLITGINYEVVPHAKVTVRGNSSSIAALRPGMKVRFVYEHIQGFDAEISARQESSVISELEQLPDSHLVEEF